MTAPTPPLNAFARLRASIHPFLALLAVGYGTYALVSRTQASYLSAAALAALLLLQVLLRSLTPAGRARRDYFALSRRAARTIRSLRTPLSMHDRAALLTQLATITESMAAAAGRFRPSSARWTTPDAYAAWTRAEAELVAALATSTAAAADGDERPITLGPAGHLWSQLQRAATPQDRAELMDAIADVMVPYYSARGVHGPQAVEILCVLAAGELQAAAVPAAEVNSDRHR